MFGWLLRLVRRNRPVQVRVIQAPAHQQAAAEGPAYLTGAEAAAEFKRRLQDTLQHQGEVQAGAIHAIGLDRLRERLGEKWERSRSAIETASRQIIGRRLAPGDMFMDFEGPTYLIVFARLTEEKAKLKCAMIAAEIERRFLGEGEVATPGMFVRAAVARLDSGLKIDSIDLRSLADDIIASSAQEIDPMKAALLSLTPSTGDVEGEGAAPAEPPTGEDAAADMPLVAAPIEGRHQLPPQMRKKRRAAALDETEWRPLGREKEIDLSGTLFFYRPTWNVRRQAVSTFHLVYEPRESQGNVAPEPKTMMGRLTLDILTARHVRDDMALLAAEGRKLLISFPLHFSSLAEPKMRPKVLEILQQVPEESRELIVAEIVDLPPGVPGLRLYEAVAAVKPMVRVVNLELALRPDMNLAILNGIRVTAVGVALTKRRTDEAKLIRSMEEFNDKAARLGLRTYIHNVPTLSLATAAICAGFTYLDGDAIARVAEGPGRMYRYHTSDIYGRLFAGGDV